MSTATVTSLPDELLLEIFRYTRTDAGARQEHLRNISQVCRSFHALATEVLLASPCVHICDVPFLVGLYFEYPSLAAKAHTLEISGYTDHPITKKYDKVRLSRHWDVLHGKFALRCLDFIDSTASAYKREWKVDLFEHPWDAWLSILLVLLERLDTIYMGDGSIENFSMFRGFVDMFDRDFDNDATEIESLRDQYRSYYPYLQESFDSISPRLHTLEVPVDWSGWSDVGTLISEPLPTPNLRRLAIPETALLPYLDEDSQDANPASLLPRSLETLIFTEVYLDPVLRSPDQEIPLIFDNIFKNRSSLPNLHTIEIFLADGYPYAEPYHKTISLLLREAAMLSIRLYIRLRTTRKVFSVDLFHGAPWRYSEADLQKLEVMSWRDTLDLIWWWIWCGSLKEVLQDVCTSLAAVFMGLLSATFHLMSLISRLLPFLGAMVVLTDQVAAWTRNLSPRTSAMVENFVRFSLVIAVVTILVTGLARLSARNFVIVESLVQIGSITITMVAFVLPALGVISPYAFAVVWVLCFACFVGTRIVGFCLGY